jgi:hypothetical protein
MPRAWVPVALDLVLSLGRLDRLPLHIGRCIGSANGKWLDVIDKRACRHYVYEDGRRRAHPLSLREGTIGRYVR